LVQCAAIYKGGQWRNVTVDRIIKDIITPFGLELKVQTDLGDKIADFKLGHGETALDAVSRAARLRGRFEGEIRRGSNVIAMDDVGTDEERHSQYTVYGQSSVGSMAHFDNARSVKAVATDAEVTRYLPMVINADGNSTQADLQRLVDHTVRVRKGRSLGFRYTVEGWTVKGKPWPVNARVPIFDDVAGLDGHEWLICSVKQHCDLKEGDVTELLVRPIEAYDTVPLKTRIKHRRKLGDAPRDGAKE
jgi:prophage tail gpP-like protein